jgi:hypothetical protein
MRFRRRELDEEARKLEKLERIYSRLIEEDQSAETGAPTEPETSSFERSLERRAQRLGTTVEALLDDYAQRIKGSRYPNAYCLRPDEVQEFARRGELSPRQTMHLRSCEGCRSLLKSGEISEGRIAELLASIRGPIAQASTEHFVTHETRSWMPSPTRTILTGFQKSLSLLGRSMPRWVPAAAVSLLFLGFAYPSVESYSKLVWSHSEIARSYPLKTIRLALERQDQQRQEALQRLEADWGLKKLAGHLPEDPSKVQEPLNFIETAAIQGVLAEKDLDAISHRRQNMQGMANVAAPKDKVRWLNYNLELAGAEALVRYEVLRAQTSSSTASVRDLNTSKVVVSDGIPAVIVESDKVVRDSQVRVLMRKSFEQTEGIQGLNVYRRDVLVYSFRPP